MSVRPSIPAFRRTGRRPARIFAGLAIALAALAALMSGAWPRSADAAPVRIMPLGDSITDGYNVPGGYRIALEDMLAAAGYDFDFVGSRVNGPDSLADRDHEGHSGLRIDELTWVVDDSVARHQPEVVLLMIGTNDILQQHRLGEAPQRLAALIDRIAVRAPSATILVSSVTPLAAAWDEERVRAYNAAIPSIVRDKVGQGRRVVFVDMHPALTTTDLADGVHPNTTGYRKMAVVWRNAVPPTADPAGPAPAETPAPGSAPPLPSPPGLLTPVAGTEPRAATPRRLVRIAGGRLRVNRRGIVRLRIACHRDAQSACAGVVRLRSIGASADGRPLASRRFRVRPATTASVRLTIDRRQHRRLRRRSATRVSIEAVVRADGRRMVTRGRGRLIARPPRS